MLATCAISQEDGRLQTTSLQPPGNLQVRRRRPRRRPRVVRGGGRGGGRAQRVASET